MTRYAVVVDPYSTGQEYPAAFRAAGVETVAVRSTAEPAGPYRASWHPENFAADHVYDGDLGALAAVVAGYRPLCVVLGAEGAVELADALTERVLPGSGNDPALAWARRDKWTMARAVRDAGIPHLAQVCADDPAVVAGWLADRAAADQPVVLKPPGSSGTDNVHIVPPGADWRPAFDQILGAPNGVGRTNEAVLAQEFAAGTEFMVDSYSVDGTHGLVDVCRYAKSRRGDRIGIYDQVAFLPGDHPDVAVVWPYVRRVLDALGVRNGCGHTEVMLTERGPLLLESAMRPAGGGHQMITELATGENQITRTVAHRVRGQFRPGYQLIRQVCSTVISAPRAGVWRNAELFDDVESLPSFWAKHFGYRTGDQVPAPAGFATMLGWVVLADPDPAIVDADYRHLKQLESRIAVDDRDTARRGGAPDEHHDNQAPSRSIVDREEGAPV